MTDISVILPVESEYEIKFCRQALECIRKFDFLKNMGVAETQFLTSGRPTVSGKWLTHKIYTSKDAHLHGLLHAF